MNRGQEHPLKRNAVPKCWVDFQNTSWEVLEKQRSPPKVDHCLNMPSGWSSKTNVMAGEWRTKRQVRIFRFSSRIVFLVNFSNKKCVFHMFFGFFIHRLEFFFRAPSRRCFENQPSILGLRSFSNFFRGCSWPGLILNAEPQTLNTF